MFPFVKKTDILRGIKTVNEIQQRMIGRHCGDLGDKLAQYCSIVQFVRSTGAEAFDNIEIGTLFGGSCLTKLFAMRDLGVRGKVICIDPMDGYYGQSTDPITGMEVNSKILYRNLEIFRFSGESIELRQTFSNSDQAYAGLNEGRFATLMIDGDHSYDGVIHDWECYRRFIGINGFVLFDDYDDPSWPDVTNAVNKIINSDSQRWRSCGRLGTTFIFQRIR